MHFVAETLAYDRFNNLLQGGDSKLLSLPGLRECEKGKTCDKLFTEAVRKVVRDFWEACEKAADEASFLEKIQVKTIKDAYAAITMKYDSYTLRSYLTDVAGWTEDAINLYDLGNAHVVFENGFVKSFEDAFLSRNKGGEQAGMKQLQKGMDAVPNGFVSSEQKENSLVDGIIYGARVTEIGDLRSRSQQLKEIHHLRHSRRSEQLPSQSPSFPCRKWQPETFATWKSPRSSSDLPIRYTMFPKTNGNTQFEHSDRGVIMAAYTFQQDATILGSLSPERRIQIAAENLNRIFPGAKSLDLLEAGASQVFLADELAGGSAFCYFGPMKKTKFLDTMQKPDWENRVFTAGEQASFTHRWIRGAFGAGLRCVQQIWSVAVENKV
ncbi:hypothetical protein FGADI_11128 [Fusarium gaditjirri]|uniref:Amine oxidase domain-containing protein n=1 Tax=Fusarium gaditjirri TaxID=282569 RepID=A0A8H4WQT5_9HYPO|nr:hypothetical protein FGADI_11128 [Fusarium gaditjirri]